MSSVPLRETPLASVVAVAPVLTSAVQLRGSLWTQDAERHAEHLDRFLPTEFGRKALLGVLHGTRAASPARVHLITGSYGTGKSYLLLVLASLLGLRLDDPRLDRLIGRIQKDDDRYGDGLAREIETARKLETASKAGYGYLVVVPDYSDREYDRAVLNALRDALCGAGLDYRFPTEFSEASRILAGWQAERPEFIATLEARLAADGSSVARLQRELDEHDGEALDRFGPLFEAVTHARYQAPRVSLEDTFRQTSDFLQKQGYRGIAVLFDEFGFFLTEAASGRAGTAVAAVQTFMEFARNRPGADILLVFATHRALGDYGTGAEGRAEMKKVEGRIDLVHRLRASPQFREAEEMMAGAFVVPPNMDAGARTAALDRLRTTARDEDWTGRAAAWYADAPAEWIQQTVVEGTYPLHPTATLALPGLSDDVGQNTRTMFRFLAPGEPGGADAFMRREPVERTDGQLALLTLADLFDYFVAPAESGAGAAGRAGTALAEYRSARAVLRVDDPLAECVLKTVAVIGLFGDPRLQATPSTLHWALHVGVDREDDVDGLLGVLAAQGALRQNQNTKIYSFRSTGGTTTDALLAEKKRQIGALTPGALRDLLRATRPPSHYDPTGYNDRVHTNRRVATDFVVPGTELSVLGGWGERFKNLYEKGDAKFYKGNLVALYGLYEDDADRARLEDTLRKASEVSTVVAAISATPTPLADLALNVAAAEALLDDPKVLADDNALNEAALLVKQYRDALASALDRSLDPAQFAWFAQGEKRYEPDTLKRRALDRFFDDLVEGAFPGTPVINSDVVQEYPSTNSTIHKKNRDAAVDQMLQPVPFSMSGTSAVDAVLQGLLKPNHMFEQKELKGMEWYGTVVAPPEDASAAAVWNVLRERLLTEGTGRRVSKMADVLPLLYRPPFGLSAPAAEVVLGAFVAVYRDGFELRDANDRQVPLSGDAVLGACRSGAFKLVHQAITPAERALLDVLDEVLTRRRLPAVTPSFGLWADPAARLSEWYRGLPDLTRKRAPHDDEDVKAIFDAIDGYTGKRDDTAARTWLTSVLADGLGVDVLNGTDGLAAFQKRLEATIKTGNRFADDYAEAVLRDAAYDVFGEPIGGSAEFEALVSRWRDTLSPAAKQHTYDGPADALVETVTRASSDDVTKRYLTTLPQSWGMAPFRAWKTNKQRADFLTTFRDAKRAVEAWRASPLPLLQRLHKLVFGNDAPVPESVEDVDVAFRNWLEALPEPTFARLESGAFGPVATALFSTIRGSGSVEVRYLDNLSRTIPQTVGPWTSWLPAAQNIFVQDVAVVAESVVEWAPPLSDTDTAALVLDRLGWPASETASATDALDASAAAWYDSLAPATKRHPFGGLEDEVVRRLRDRSGLASGLTESLPRAAGLPALHEAGDAASAEALADRLAEAIQRVEAWRRPVLDVLQRVADLDGNSQPLSDASTFTLRLGEWVRALDPTPTPDGMAAPAAALLAWAGAGSRWDPAFRAFVDACGLESDVHTWRPSDDSAFEDAFGAARAEVAAWTPPPADPALLRSAVSKALRDVVRQTGASPDEIRSVLFQAAADLG